MTPRSTIVLLGEQWLLHGVVAMLHGEQWLLRQRPGLSGFVNSIMTEWFILYQIRLECEKSTNQSALQRDRHPMHCQIIAPRTGTKAKKELSQAKETMEKDCLFTNGMPPSGWSASWAKEILTQIALDCGDDSDNITINQLNLPELELSFKTTHKVSHAVELVTQAAPPDIISHCFYQLYSTYVQTNL
ncbi:hypothetical protein SERLA73DRAFT_162380 [Serpula lacrymans var. lacrymans S7.3]|uniref:Uncharacterized protein n=1 Tax=Serpula lacrymans var. lacrymans (strain S7.3) TaxID=936435 RepID=F8Q7K7_SERL3|nr:hypothetical protein SERLA73DRAFT_162380 [Serpula lacrymans var. lacrymans S7.3]